MYSSVFISQQSKFPLVIPTYCCSYRFLCVGFFFFVIILKKPASQKWGYFNVAPLHAFKLAKPYTSSSWGPQMLLKENAEKHSSKYVHAHAHAHAHTHTHLWIPPPQKGQPNAHLGPSFESPTTLGLGLVPRPSDSQVSSRWDPEGGMKYRYIAMVPNPLQPFRWRDPFGFIDYRCVGFVFLCFGLHIFCWFFVGFFFLVVVCLFFGCTTQLVGS